MFKIVQSNKYNIMKAQIKEATKMSKVLKQVYLNEEQFKKIKIEAVMSGKTMQVILEDALNQYLNNKGDK